MTERAPEGVQQMSAADIYMMQEERIALYQERVRELEAELAREPLTLEQALGNLEPDESYEPVYEIRGMHHGDFKRLIQMVRKVRNHEGLQEAIKSSNQTAAVNASFEILLDELEEEFLPWLQDLAQVSEKSDEDLPLSFTFDVLNDLKSNKDFLGALRSATYFVMTGKRLFGR